MPLYDYRCSACDAVHEHRQKISDAPLTQCPDCGGEYKRIITSVGIIFKGSGFHINDYRGGGGKSKGGDEGSPKTDSKTDATKDSSSSDKGSEAKGDAKPSDPPSSTTSEGSQSKQVA